MNCPKKGCKGCVNREECGTISKVIIKPDGTVNLGWCNPMVEKLISKIGKETSDIRPLKMKKKKSKIYCG